MRNPNNHVSPLLALLAGCLLHGCAESPEVPVADPVTTAPPESSAPVLEWVAPLHPIFQVYVNNYALGDRNGAINQSNSGWSPESKGNKASISTGPPGAVPYSCEWQYKGRLKGKDQYFVTVTHPTEWGGSVGFGTNRLYEGVDIEFFRDDTHRIGMRPTGPQEDR